MNGHDIFIESHIADDNASRIGIAVLCSCGDLLLEVEHPGQPQIALDAIVDAAWYHRDSHLHIHCKECRE